MHEFAKSCYDNFVYFNFDEEDELKSIFKTNKNPQRIVELLSLIANERILPGKGKRIPFHVEPRYFATGNREIDFVLQRGTEIIPVEAKGGEGKSETCHPLFKARL